MNKLEEWIEKQAETADFDHVYRHGAYDIVELNLPLKFYRWMEDPEIESTYFIGKPKSIENLYKYWIENVLIIE